MASSIANFASTAFTGVNASQRRLWRCQNGVLWFLAGDRVNNRLSFWFSTNNGGSWAEDTSQRIPNVDVGQGASGRIGVRKDGAERIACIYRRDGSERMKISFGVFETKARTSFRWHSAGFDRNTSSLGDPDYSRPDCEVRAEGNNWIVSSWWGERDGTTGLLWMGRTRFFPYDSKSVEQTEVHKRGGMNAIPRVAVAHRHSGHPHLIHEPSPDLYIAWSQGLNTDVNDRSYVMRLTADGTVYRTGTQRRLLDDSCHSGLLASCFTGQRFAAVIVPAGASSTIEMLLMTPEDGGRSVIPVPDLNLGEYTSLSVTWDNETHDIYILACGTSNKRPHYIRYTWSSRTFGSWVQINTETVLDDTLTAKPGSSGSRIEFSYAINPGSSTTYKYELATITNKAPRAAKWISEGGARDINEDLTHTWAHDDPDDDPQVQYEFRRTVNNGSLEYWNGSTWQGTEVQPSSSAETVTEDGGTWGDDEDIIRYTVRTNDGQGWGPFSATRTVVGSVKVNPTIIAPPAGNDNEPGITLEWTVAEQSAYRFWIEAGTGGDIIHGPFTFGSSVVRDRELSYIPGNGEQITIFLQTQNNEGLWSDADSVTILGNYILPPTPVVTETAVPAEGAIDVGIANGTPGGGEDPAHHNWIYRDDESEPEEPRELITDTLGEPIVVGVNATYRDRLIRSGHTYTYYVRAFTAAGANKMSDE